MFAHDDAGINPHARTRDFVMTTLDRGVSEQYCVRMTPTLPNARTPIVLEVAGQRLRLNAGADTDENHLARVSAIVNERFERISKQTRGAPTHTLLALLSLDLADEILSLRRRMEEIEEQARKVVSDAEARAREVEQMARRAIAEAIAEIDRSLTLDEELSRKTGESETA